MTHPSRENNALKHIQTQHAQITKTEAPALRHFLLPITPPPCLLNQTLGVIVFLCELFHIGGVGFPGSQSATWQARSVLSVIAVCPFANANRNWRLVTTETVLSTKKICLFPCCSHSRNKNYSLLPARHIQQNTLNFLYFCIIEYHSSPVMRCL